jgi:hypothetical protein
MSSRDDCYATSFEQVAAMNEAFGNPKGDLKNINQEKVFNQCTNILDEYGELMAAFGADPVTVKLIVREMKDHFHEAVHEGSRTFDLTQARDALCDIHVFAYGAHHLMGIDADGDMKAVVDGVMTRFIKDPLDKQMTVELHARKGVTDVYFEGDYPTMVMKSASDQPDAPKGKFLKSASYRDTVFPPVE